MIAPSLRIARHRIQYASNLCISGKRLCHPSQYLLPVQGAHLALLGNIGRPNQELAEFFRWCEYNYDHIYWVPGDLELSSPREAKQDIHERPMFLSEWLRNQSIHHVSVCTKHVLHLQNPSVTLLFTPMFHRTREESHPILHQYQNGDLHEVKNRHLKRLEREETDWLLQEVVKSLSPTICMTATEVNWRTPLMKYHKQDINPKKIIGMLYGRTSEATLECRTESSSKGLPWRGVNMFGHKYYNPYAFLEYTKHQTINPKEIQ